tara:strand:+ start:202 stop:417 length:216 start_codon:yes stop_codon:yes gene_type:complete
MLRRLLTGKKNNPIKLGRWGTNKAFLQQDQSNHDHCGSDVCKTYFDKNKNIQSDKNNKEQSEYFLPFTTMT